MLVGTPISGTGHAPAPHMRGSRALRALACGALGLALFAAPAPLARAAGGVELTAVYLRGVDAVDLAAATSGAVVEGVDTSPSVVCVATLQFSKNVAYNNGDGDFAYRNERRVHLYGPDGQEVAGSRLLLAYYDHSLRQYIQVCTDEWLAPLTTYTLVVDEGVEAANGEDVSTCAYTVTFRTGPDCQNGFTVYENAAMVAAPSLAACGVAVQLVRNRRRAR